MGHVKDHRAAVRHLLHHVEAQHIHNQVVVTKVGTAIAEDHLVVAAFGKLIDNVTHLAWADELRFFDVDHRAGFRHRFNQIGLTGQEGRQLDHVHHVSHGLRLAGFMHIGDHLHTEGRFDVLENAHSLFQAWATV